MAWMIDSALAAMLPCVSITPLGSPVLPLEKMIVARSSMLVPAEAEEPAFLDEAGQQQHASNAADALDVGDALAEVFEVDQLDARARIERHLVREAAST